MGNYDDLLSKIFDESEATILRKDAVIELARMKDPRCLADLLRACAVGNKYVRRKAIEMLSQWDHHSTFGDITSALDHEDEETRRLALKTLGLLGARILSDAVQKGMSDKSRIVRRTAEDIIKRLEQTCLRQIESSAEAAADTPAEPGHEHQPVEINPAVDLSPDIEPKRWMVSPEFPSPPEATAAPSDASNGAPNDELALTNYKSEEKERSLIGLSRPNDMFDKIARPLLREETAAVSLLQGPPLSKANGPCAIVRMTRDEIHIPTVGRLIAKAKKVPLYDVTREINISKGFLAKDMDASVAKEAAQQLEEMGIPVFIIEMKDLVRLPEPARVTSLVVSDDHLDCEVHSWDWTIPKRIAKTWDDIGLITCGRLEIRRQRTVTVEEDEEKQGTVKPKWWSSRIDREPQEKLVVEVIHKFLIDIFFRQDGVEGELRERARIGDDVTLGEREASIELLQQEESVDVFWAAKELSAFVERVPISDGVKLLAQNGARGRWANLTFVTKKDFDAYNSWLLQLIKMREALHEQKGR